MSTTAIVGNRRHKRNEELDLFAGQVLRHDPDIPLGTGKLTLNFSGVREGDMGAVFVLTDHHEFDVVDGVTGREWLKYSILYSWGIQQDTQFVLENMPPGKYTVSGASAESHYGTQVSVAMMHAYFDPHLIELEEGEEMVMDLVAP